MRPDWGVGRGRMQNLAPISIFEVWYADCMEPNFIVCEVEVDDFKCQRPMTDKKRKMCNAHSIQARTGKELSPPRERKGINLWGTAVCVFEDCGRQVRAKGLCAGHYYQQRHVGTLSPISTRQRPVGAAAVRNEAGEKECYSCRKWLPESAFTILTPAIDGLSHICRACAKEARADWREAAKINRIERFFNLPYAQYQQMLIDQDYRCAVCAAPESEQSVSLHIDHDHACCPERSRSCGECIRGLICARCNLALGQVEDSPELLRKMIDYLGTRAGGDGV